MPDITDQYNCDNQDDKFLYTKIGIKLFACRKQFHIQIRYQQNFSANPLNRDKCDTYSDISRDWEKINYGRPRE